MNPDAVEEFLKVVDTLPKPPEKPEEMEEEGQDDGGDDEGGDGEEEGQEDDGDDEEMAEQTLYDSFNSDAYCDIIINKGKTWSFDMEKHPNNVSQTKWSGECFLEWVTHGADQTKLQVKEPDSE